MKLVEDCQNRRRKVSYRKQIAREHSYHQNYGQTRSVVDPVNFFLTSISLITMQNFVAVSRAVFAHV